MCLEYVTPHGFLSARLEAPCYPLECTDKATILTLVGTELAGGIYDDAEVYHPFIPVILRGIVANHDRMNPRWSEPQYPFCDIMQSVGLVFGFVNNNPHIMPDRETQDTFLRYPVPGICWQVYTIVRSVVMTCVDKPEVQPWKEQMAHWLAFSGAAGLIMELAERRPELIQLTSRGLVPGEMAPV